MPVPLTARASPQSVCVGGEGKRGVGKGCGDGLSPALENLGKESSALPVQGSSGGGCRERAAQPRSGAPRAPLRAAIARAGTTLPHLFRDSSSETTQSLPMLGWQKISPWNPNCLQGDIIILFINLYQPAAVWVSSCHRALRNVLAGI